MISSGRYLRGRGSPKRLFSERWGRGPVFFEDFGFLLISILSHYDATGEGSLRLFLCPEGKPPLLDWAARQSPIKKIRPQ
jgi:hypothetical protein